jgi:Fe-S-cluster containining protein
MSPTGRICGDCDLCCTVLRVDELAKRARQPCDKLRTDGPGCSIHQTRPDICRGYTCAWLQGSFGDDDRPDRLGAVLDLLWRGDRLWLEIHLASPEAWERSDRLRGIADEYREVALVRISNADRRETPDAPYRILLGDGVEQRIKGDRVDVYRDGKRVESSRVGLAHRILASLRRTWSLYRSSRASGNS